MALSCEVNGELKYIWKFRDFQECMEPSVFDAVKQFFGAEEEDGNFVERLRDAEYRANELDEKKEDLEDEIRELENENDDLRDQIEELERETEKTELYEKKLAAIAEILKEDKP